MADTIPTINVITKSDNRSSLRLTDCGPVVDLTSVTKVEILTLSGVVIDSDAYPTCFQWVDTPEGTIFFFLGKEDIGLSTGAYNSKLTLYDDLNSFGLWFGDIRLMVFRKE